MATSTDEQPHDPRRLILSGWLASLPRRHAIDIATLAPASNDASFRRYFRVQAGERSLIVMDAPPEREDVRPFIHVAHLLRDAGLNAPEVLEADERQGFLLLTDLGVDTYLSVLDDNNAAELFEDAIDALLRWQLATRPGELPPYDEALLQRELSLFPDWYVARHLQVELSSAQRQVLDAMFDAHHRRQPGPAARVRAS